MNELFLNRKNIEIIYAATKTALQYRLITTACCRVGIYYSSRQLKSLKLLMIKITTIAYRNSGGQIIVDSSSMLIVITSRQRSSKPLCWAKDYLYSRNF
jgi:hypothetical protein